MIFPVISESFSAPASVSHITLGGLGAAIYLFTFQLMTAIALPPDKNILIVSTLRHRLITVLMADGIFIKLYTTAAKTKGIAGG